MSIPDPVVITYAEPQKTLLFLRYMWTGRSPREASATFEPRSGHARHTRADKRHEALSHR